MSDLREPSLPHCHGHIPDQANYFVLVAQGIALLFIPVIVAAARRWDKRTALFLGFGGMVPVLAAIAAVPAKWLGNAAPAVGTRSEPMLPGDRPNLDVPDANALVPPRTGVAHGRR